MDFDGVLNNERFIRRQRNLVNPGEQKLFDPENIHALNVLCDRGGITAIVVTSTWRVGRSLKSLRQMLRESEFQFDTLVQEATPVLGASYESREQEIREWLVAHPGMDFLILDDWNFSDVFGAKAIHVASSTGLTLETVALILTTQ